MTGKARKPADLGIRIDFNGVADEKFSCTVWDDNSISCWYDSYNYKQSATGKSAFWYCDDRLHRENGPARVTGDCREWYRHGKLHREDGPAIEWSDGETDYYLNDRYLPEGARALPQKKEAASAGLARDIRILRPLKIVKRP